MNNEPSMHLSEQHCSACQGLVDVIAGQELPDWMVLIHSEWQLSDEGKYIERHLRFKNFSQTMFFINAVAHMADQQGHHPDVQFGYNKATIQYTTHEAGGLTRNDFICAKKVDQIVLG